MDSEAAWDITTGSSAVTVGICDTGIQLGHPDLEPTRLPGFVRVGSTVYEGADCPDHVPGCTTGGDVSYVHPHGTNCAGEERCIYSFYISYGEFELTLYLFAQRVSSCYTHPICNISCSDTLKTGCAAAKGVS